MIIFWWTRKAVWKGSVVGASFFFGGGVRFAPFGASEVVAGATVKFFAGAKSEVCAFLAQVAAGIYMVDRFGIDMR